MAWIKIDPGLTEARRFLRDADHALRRYCDRVQIYGITDQNNPKTSDQEASRDAMRRAGKAWKSLTQSQRDQWTAYAQEYAESIGEEAYKDLSGWDVYMPAFRNLSLRGELPTETPVADNAPPGPVTAVEEFPSDDERTFTFRISHAVSTVGHSLVVRITQAMEFDSNKPVARRCRMICGYSAGSIVPLPANSGTVTFTNAQFAIPSGRRYGIEVRIVRNSDGVHSKPFFMDTRRTELLPAPPQEPPTQYTEPSASEVSGDPERSMGLVGGVSKSMS